MGKNNRPHVYLKVSEESETGKKLQSFIDDCNRVSERATSELLILFQNLIVRWRRK